MDTLPLSAYPAMTPERRAELLADTRRAPCAALDTLDRLTANVAIDEREIAAAFARLDESRAELLRCPGGRARVVESLLDELDAMSARAMALRVLLGAAHHPDVPNPADVGR